MSAAEDFFYTCKLTTPANITNCGLYVGGIKAVWLTKQPIYNIVSDNYGVINDIFDDTLSYLTVNELPADSDTQSFTETQELTDNGLRYISNLSMSKQGFDPVLTQYLYKYSQSKFSAVILNRMNQYYFVQNLRFTQNNYSGGLNAKELNSSAYTLTANSLYPMRKLSDSAVSNITFA